MEKTFEEKLAEARSNISAVSPQQASDRKTSDPDTLFIDPRDASDIESTGIIPGAINLQLNELSEKPVEELMQKLVSRSRPIITSCGAGPMGALAAYALKQRGFNNVSFIDGGTQGWLDAGYSTAK